MLSRRQVVVPSKIGDRLVHTEELLEMNLKRRDASPDELLREEPQPGDRFVRQTAAPAETIRRNQEPDQQFRQVRPAQDPSKEYGSTSAGLLALISLHPSKPVEESSHFPQPCTKIGLQSLGLLYESVNCLETGGKSPELVPAERVEPSASPFGSSESYTSGYYNGTTATNPPTDNHWIGH
jgi:hypothetical protein